MKAAWQTLAAVTLVGALAPAARSDDGLAGPEQPPQADAPAYDRISVTTNVIYLVVPVFTLDVELAFHPRWSVAVRGGLGYFDALGLSDRQRIFELGGRGEYYVVGNANRGVQVGIDTRFVSYQGDGMLTGLDGAAIGPYVGYKRVFGSGVTLGAQLGAHVVVAGESDGPVVPHVALSLGWSFWHQGRATAETSTGLAPPGLLASSLASSLDYHRGLLFGFSLGGGLAVVDGCDSCKLEPGLAVDASVGWFVGRRVAVVLDSTAMVALFSLSSGFGGLAFGLGSVGVQVWPHENVWIKVGVGAAEVVSNAVGGAGVGLDVGGGGTLAVGYEFHHDRGFAMDFQLRATHGSVHPANDRLDGVDAFVGVVGLKWY